MLKSLLDPTSYRYGLKVWTVTISSLDLQICLAAIWIHSRSRFVTMVRYMSPLLQNTLISRINTKKRLRPINWLSFINIEFKATNHKGCNKQRPKFTTFISPYGPTSSSINDHAVNDIFSQLWYEIQQLFSGIYVQIFTLFFKPYFFNNISPLFKILLMSETNQILTTL